MNIKVVAACAAGLAVWGVGYILNKSMRKGFDSDVDNAIDREVYNKFGEEMKAARSDLAIAKADAQKIYDIEIAETKEIVAANERYMTAKANVDSGKKQLDILKKQLKTAQNGNSTSVAATSGNSSVAVSIKDTSQITQLQSDISKLETEIRQNEVTRDTIWKLERNNVAGKRSISDQAIVDRVKDADRQVTHVKFESELFKNELRDDNNFMYDVQAKSYLKHYKPWKQILSTALISIPCIMGLAYCWYWTIKGVNTYYSLQKEVVC